jgi:cell wall assembly regulator SMI1
MTSNDRHASHDSPYRTGQHVPLNQNRHAPLTSVATTAAESRHDLASPYEDELSKQRSTSTNGWPGSPGSAKSPSRPYSPGMRSLSGKAAVTSENEVVSPGEIQMQNFADGGPPAPPASHSWKKIDRWAEKNYEELYDQLGGGCTQNDINELEHELDCSLPQDVRDSLTIHDGQERGGRPTGIIFGCMLLDCEEIVQEWKNWKLVNEEYLSGQTQPQPQYPIKGLNTASSSTSRQSQNTTNPQWRQELLDRQDSQPPKAIQKAYSHPGWIPLARDWGGNNIGVDLAPGPMGKWGQVILFGRDYDCKCVIARSWAVFLSIVADDMESDKVLVDEESGELKLKEFKQQNVEPAYLDILRWRADQKYGPRRPRKAPLNLNTNVGGKSPRESPYNSPTIANDEGGRGRSPNRFSRGPNASPRTQVGSPLARHHEEVIAPIPMRAGGDFVKDFASAPEVLRATHMKPEKLVDVPTPTAGVDVSKPNFRPERAGSEAEMDKENTSAAGLGVGGVEAMRSVQI